MNRKLLFVLKLSVIAAMVALTFLVYFQQGDFTSLDLGRHLKNGQLFWSQPDVLFKNFYSYTEADFPFINHHWLAGVIFWLLYLIGGFKILTALNIILGLTAFLLIFKLAARKASPAIAGLLAIPVILLLSERVDIRPEMFSYLFLALVYYLLEDYRRNGRAGKLVWLAPLFLLWVNSHIYFFIGLFLVALAFLEQLILRGRNFFASAEARKFFYCVLGSLAACLLNPNFIKGLFYPLNILKKYGYDIVENKSPFYLENLMINHNILIFKILLALLAVSFILPLILKRKVDWYYLILSAVFAVFACLYIRNLPIFGLISLPILAGNFQSVFGDWEAKATGRRVGCLIFTLAAYLLAIGWLIFDNFGQQEFLNKNFGLGMEKKSLASIEFYQSNGLSGPIFNNYDLGSALIFWLNGREKVFVDNRPEAYSQDFFQKIYKPMQQEKEQWKSLSAAYDFNIIYFSHTDGTPWARQFLSDRLRDQNWPLVYFDDYILIMLKDNEKNKKVIGERKIDGEKFAVRLNELAAAGGDKQKLNLANLAVIYGRADLAEDIYRSLLSSRPKDGKIFASLGYLYAAGRSSQEIMKSLDYLQKSLNCGYRLPGVYNQMGLDYWALGDYNQAKKMWSMALRLDSADSSANYYLGQAEELLK